MTVRRRERNKRHAGDRGRGESWFKRSQGEDCFDRCVRGGFVGHEKVASFTHLFCLSLTAVIEPSFMKWQQVVDAFALLLYHCNASAE